MNLRDISNQDVASLANCESEPIHTPGAIQPHGVLVAVDDGIIQFCSKNCELFFGRSPSFLLHQLLENIHPVLYQQLQKLQQDPVIKPITILHEGQEWTVFMSESGDLTIIELEMAAASDAVPDLFDQTSEFVQLIERAQSLAELCQRIADQTRKLTGYDRVMIYRFDRDNNGEVYAESRREDLEPYLHLHYPHTDIPPQARELYLLNPMRMIADVAYTAVPLLTSSENHQFDLDLSHSVLRSVSPIHLQYLKNMGVAATLTISLVSESRLWGLIACHHLKPKHLNWQVRQTALLQGHFLTSQIKVRQVAEEYNVHTVVEAHLQQLLSQVPREGDFAIKFEGFTSLLAVANASGVAVLHNGVVYEKGLVPPQDKTKALFSWLSEHVESLQFSTSHLRVHYTEAEKISRYAAGILYHKLGNAKRDAIIWFREERERTIHWAGDPYEAVRKVKENQLKPRTSFAIFKENIRFHSLEWRVSELNAASRFASALQNQFHLDYLKLEEAKQRLLNEQLLKANRELSNINWITSHDLKEPLRKILVFASKMIHEGEHELPERLLASVEKIQQSAVRMQTLVNDIIAYTQVDDKSSVYEPTDLNKTMSDVAAEYEDELHETGGTLKVGPLPIVRAIPYQMRQLFVNLLGNALKFTKVDTSPAIDVQCTEITQAHLLPYELRDGKTYYRVNVSDNGIGFEPDQGNRLFDIFYRLSNHQTYKGNGMGLAICKRIVESHGGAITATGEIGVGATISLYLPKE